MRDISMKRFAALNDMAQSYACGWQSHMHGLTMRFCPFYPHEPEYTAFVAGMTDAGKARSNNCLPRKAALAYWSAQC